MQGWEAVRRWGKQPSSAGLSTLGTGVPHSGCFAGAWLWCLWTLPCLLLISLIPEKQWNACLQVYGFGASEEYLSQFMRDTSTQVVVATKFAPLPWRFTRSTVVDACK